MNNNALKINLGVTLGQGARQKALDHIQITGKNLPATIKSMKGSIATVEFQTDGTFTLPNVTIPMHMPEYLRLPMQPGDKGVVIAGDVNTSNMSGLGPKTPSSFTRPGNLSPLVFIPVGNVDFTPVDPNKHVSYGPYGTLSRPSDMSSGIGTDKDTGATVATGKPTGTDPANVDLTTYDHHVGTSSSGVKAKSKTKVDVEAPTHNVTATTAMNVTSPNANFSANVGVAGVLAAASAVFGAVAGSGAGGVMSLPKGVALGGGLGATTSAITIAYTYWTPLSGGTVTVDVNSPVTLINPAGFLAALTVDFPVGIADGTIIVLSFTQGVTTVTTTGATFAPNAALSTVPSNGSQYRFLYAATVGAGTWFRI